MPGDTGWQPYQGLVHKTALAWPSVVLPPANAALHHPGPVPANFRCENNGNGGLSGLKIDRKRYQT